MSPLSPVVYFQSPKHVAPDTWFRRKIISLSTTTNILFCCAENNKPARVCNLNENLMHILYKVCRLFCVLFHKRFVLLILRKGMKDRTVVCDDKELSSGRQVQLAPSIDASANFVLTSFSIDQ